MGTTISHVVISYDVDRLHTQVKSSMESLGYKTNFSFSGSSKIYQLPNTSLWHGSKSSDQAMDDLKKTCNGLRVTLEKAIAVKADEFVGI
ncbi:hypothetical protein [Chryseobacterium wangxinyae]|uniref:hypothetical protein n=1 Tax=Chryseobacterium sp. CY353 TaxID=2997334 RepID=UPI002271EBD5|nr:hypothetical protein [Chryseobacterium sp. CY353]MCY0969969.1 hypothetical protein [Chryseobacterium sp. CY353]